jgi:hypothetical protein
MIYLYCGTHTKGVPCSIMDKNESDAPKPNQESINIWVQNIKGIEYFIDGSHNVYKHEDVITPQIRALLPNMRKMMLVHFLFHSCKYLGNYIFK